MMFFKSFGLRKAGKTKKHPRWNDYHLRLERLEEKALLAVVLPSLPAGSQYQLIVATSLTTTATSADVAYYDNLASVAGSNVAGVPSATWKAWCSTPTVNAVDNVQLYSSIPIYNTKGQLVANGKTEFLSPVHHSPIFSETGDPLLGWLNDNPALVWTGSSYAGLGAGTLGTGDDVGQLGAPSIFATAGAWSSQYNWSKSFTFGIYAVSSVLTAGSTATTPGQPTSLIGTPGNGQVSLNWSAPTSAGGSVVTDYAIEYSSTGGNPWTRVPHEPSTATTATVTGLTNANSYVFRVAAVNSFGAGGWSANSSSVSPRSVPAAPTNVIGTPGNSQVWLTWAAPTDTGGSPLTDYKIQHSINGTDWSEFPDGVSKTASKWVTGLTNGTGYMFRVAAVNAAGTSGWSSISAVVTPCTVPSLPTNVSGISGNGQVTLSWTAPSDDGGSPISDYTIQLNENRSGWVYYLRSKSTATAANITGLLNDYSYEFRVLAVNAVGIGGWSASSPTVTPRPVPTNVVGIAGNSEVLLRWTAPALNGGSAVSDYTIEYRSNGNDWELFSDSVSPTTTTMVTGLTNGTSYAFRVAAVVASGTGSWSSPTGWLTPRPTGDFIYTSSDGQITITGYVGASLSVLIPATIDGLPVTTIGSFAFRDQTDLTAVTIPSSVTSISENAFNGCTSLTSIAIPSTVLSIAPGAFAWCTSLVSLDIPFGVTSISDAAFTNCTSLAFIAIPTSVTSIGVNAFDGCTSLSSLVLPSNLTDIMVNAFNGCESLVTIAIPPRVSNIGGGAFGRCTKLVSITVDPSNDNYIISNGLLLSRDGKTLVACPAGRIDPVIIPLGVNSIGDQAFEGCIGLTTIGIPTSVTNIGWSAFSGCSSLTAIAIPSGVTNIGQYAFWGCSRLTVIAIPSGLTRIGTSTFSFCGSLVAITIPNTVTSIEESAFSACSSLVSVTIPASVRSVGDEAFSECVALTNVFMLGNVPEAGTNVFQGVPAAIAYYLRGTTGWSSTWAGIPAVVSATPNAPTNVIVTPGNGQVSLSWAAPSDNGGSVITGYIARYSADEKVTWSTPIPVGASPTTLTIPGLVNGHNYWVEIASQNTAGVGYYTNPISTTPNGTVEFLFTVNSGEATITNYKGTSPVQNVPSSIGGYPVTGLVARAFTTGLGLLNNTVTAIRIPATVTSITGDWWFSALESIDVDASNTNYASSGGILYSKDMRTLIRCPVRLDGQVNVPNGVVTVGDKAFSGCKLIPLITIPNTTSEIGTGAFSGSGLVNIALPESIHSIGAGAFSECRSLTQINIPAGVKMIPRVAFNACFSLTEVRIADGVVSIDRSAFDSCLSLVSLTLPASVVSLGSRAFADCPSLARVMFLGNAPAAVDGVFINDAAAVVCYQRGTSGWTNTYFGIPTATTPGDLSLPSAIGSASSVLLSWTAPTDTGGRPITDYRVQYRVDGGTSWIDVDDGVSAATTASVNNLLNGTSYVFRLAAENIAGVGAWSSQSTSATPHIDIPSAPDSLVVISGNGQVSLSWTAPSDNGGSPITDYTIQYSSTGSAPWTLFSHTASTATTATVAGLTNGTSYVFQVAAVNDAGTGAFSDPTPRATPLAAVPGRPTAAAGNGFVVLRWAAPRLVRMPPITDYAIRYSSDNGSTWTLYPHVASAATSRRLILTNGNTYIFQVAPVVSGGVGRYSLSSLPATPFSPAAKPAAPSGVVGVKTGALISVSWNPVPRNAGGPVKDYVVQYRVNTPNARWVTYRELVSPATSANLRLRTGYNYVFRVAAKNLAGVGAYSAQSAPVTAFLASITQPPSSPLQISSVYLHPTRRADR